MLAIRADATDAQIARLRKRRKRAGSRRLRRRVPTLRDPRAVQLKYQRALLKQVAFVKTEILKTIIPLFTKLEGTREDSPESDLASALRRVRGRVLKSKRVVSGTTASVSAAVRGTIKFNGREMNRIFEATLGVGLPASEPFLVAFAKRAAKTNIRLSKSLLDGEFDRAAKTISTAFAKGLRHEELAKKLDEQFGIVERRAKLIARDQIASLNGELNRLRQSNVGITHYFWRDSNDERVRPTHEEFDGQRYSWETGSPEGHPGEPIDCRCVAEPDIEALLQATAP